MPGFYGCVGRTDRATSLSREFAAVWPSSQTSNDGAALLGAHAHGGRAVLHHFHADGSTMLVDGDVRLLAKAAHGRVWDPESGAPGLPCPGCVAVVDRGGDRLRLATDWTGSFPIYYAERDGALLFSTLLGPLARAVEAPADPVGVAEYILHDYTFAGRTMREGVRRLLPGQVLEFDARAGRSTIRETSGLWVGTEKTGNGDDARLVDRAWFELLTALNETLEAAPRHALMLSAGWDSRLILAGLLAVQHSNWSAYSHGNLRSRELRTIGRMCEDCGVAWRREALVPEAFQPPTLRHAMDRSESILFPPWGRAGMLLSQAGIGAIVAGVYGEVLGGHYSPAFLQSARDRGISIFASLLGRAPAPGDAAAGAARIREVARARHHSKPRFVSRAFLESRGPLREAMDSDLESDLQRLLARGIATEEQFVEAFIAEHRGSHYINAQLLASRPWVDVALPLADRELLRLASRIPLAAKLQNALHRRIIATRGPHLLRYPTAAVWVPASAPIVLQETSRAGRWLVEKLRWKLSTATRGRIAPDPSGWWNFEFLRGSREFDAMSQDLRGVIWDKDEVGRWVNGAAEYADGRPVYPDILLKAYAVELSLR